MIAWPKKMTSLGILISLLLFCSNAVAAEKYGICGFWAAHHGPVFSLHIERAFHVGVDFKLCEREEPGRSFLLVTRDPDNRNQVDDPIKIPLNDATHQKLLTLYDNALEYNVKDVAGGLDGSSWCLETWRGSNHSKACFWSPGLDSEARRLTGLEKLGRELWSIAAIEPKDGPLY